MSKEAELKQAKKDREIAMAAFDKEIKGIEAEIEAEKKPELRRGDFYYKSGHGKPMLVIKDGRRSEMIDEHGEIYNSTGPRYNLAAPIINGFDELKALQEDVTEFKMEDSDKDYGQRSICAELAYDKLRLQFTDNVTNRTITVHLKPKELSAFILSIRQMEATQERRQK